MLSFVRVCVRIHIISRQPWTNDSLDCYQEQFKWMTHTYPGLGCGRVPRTICISYRHVPCIHHTATVFPFVAAWCMHVQCIVLDIYARHQLGPAIAHARRWICHPFESLDTHSYTYKWKHTRRFHLYGTCTCAFLYHIKTGLNIWSISIHIICIHVHHPFGSLLGAIQTDDAYVSWSGLWQGPTNIY